MKQTGRKKQSSTQRKKRQEKKRKEMRQKLSAQALHRVDKPRDMVLNTQVRDSSSKVIFDNHILCSQFLRDYVDLPYLKDVKPEDIEDVSAQFVTLFAQERNSDRVKRVHISGTDTPFFLVSLIEHKTAPDYNVCMQIFRYMVYIWESYEKEAEKIQKGMAKQQDFRYPPILPIIYYEGAKEWCVPPDFKSRIYKGEDFGKLIPDFEYYLVPLRDYSNETLMEKRDEISLVMLINKMQKAEDIETFRKLPGEEIDAVLLESPDYLVNVIADVLKAFLLKINVPISETEKLTGKVREKKMAELFADMEKMDIQAERRKTAEAENRANEAENRANEAEAYANEEKIRADKAEIEGIKSLIELCQEVGLSKEAAIRKLMDKKGLNQEESASKVEIYWKD